MAYKIPIINIMAEADEEEDHDINTLSLTEALTDIEEINDFEPKRTKPKLLIKLPQNDIEPHTDVEDIEGSDIEDSDTDNEYQLGSRIKPVNLDRVPIHYDNKCEYYDIGQSVGKFTLGCQRVLYINGKPKLRRIEENLTDIECFSGDEEKITFLVKDTVVPRYFISNDVICTKESIKYDAVQGSSSCATQYISESEINTNRKDQIMRLSVSLPQIHDVTDVEMLDSEYDSGESYKKKSKKCRKRRNKKVMSNDKTGLNELRLINDQQQKKYSRCSYLDPNSALIKKSRKSAKTCSANSESPTDEEEICFPVPKRGNTSPQNRYSTNYFHKNMYRFVNQSTSHEKPSVDINNREYRKNQCTEPQNCSRSKIHRNIICSTDVDNFDWLDDSCSLREGRKKQHFKPHIPSLSKIRRNIICSTDVENFDSVDDSSESQKYSVLTNTIDPYLTDEEYLDSENYIDSIPDIKLPPPKREAISIKEIENCRPTILISPLNEDAEFGLNFPSEELTDIESLSGDEHFLTELPEASNDLVEVESGNIEEHESLIDARSTRRNLTVSPQIQEVHTDTEDIFLDVRGNTLNTSNPHNHSGLTDTEDIYLSDPEKRNTTSIVGPLDSNKCTISSKKRKSDTVQQLKTTGRDNVEGRYQKVNEGSHSNTLNQLGKKNETKIKQKTSEIMYLKGGNFSDILVDYEDFPNTVDEEGIYACRRGNKYIIARCTRSRRSYKVKLLANVKSRRSKFSFLTMFYLNYGYDIPINDESRGKRKFSESIAKLVRKYESLNSLQTNVHHNPVARILRVKSNFSLSHKPSKEVSYKMFSEWKTTDKQSKDKPTAPIEKEDMQPDTNPLDTRCPTYESVLLKDLNRNILDPNQKTTSYSHIDAMLDRMLTEVEKTEKLFSLDLDAANQDGSCINTLELIPSSDALIEIPLKKTYESRHQIEIIDDCSIDSNFGTVSFRNVSDALDSDVYHDYDIIDFSESTANDLKDIENSINKLIMEVEGNEPGILLDDTSDKNYLESITFINSKYQQTLCEESMKDYSESLIENEIQDYEPIDLHKHSVLTMPHPGNDIWYEGIYRNLSIVPEEDEENTSLSGSTTNKNYERIDVDFPGCSMVRQHRTSDESESDSSEGTDEKLLYPAKDKIIKAEIKLLVKTTEHGKEAIEIRSVKEFVENSERKYDDQYIKRSKTLPAKQSKKEKFSKVYSGSCFDIRTSDKENVPVFTLPRIFIKAPQAFKDAKNRNEIYATPTKNFPLYYNYDQNVKLIKNPTVDLYANTPFKPCYSRIQTISLPQAYCDWVPQNHDTGGLQPTPTAKYLASSEELSIDSPKTDKRFTNDVEHPSQTNDIDIDRETKTRSRDSSREDISRGDEKKPKRGFFGTLRSMVSKSQDRSDSDSEKPQKKGKKKDKKKKKKPPVKPPETTPIKPKLPTPPPLVVEDRLEFQDIPFVEYSPQESHNGLSTTAPVTDIDISDEIKAVANEIVSDVIAISENTATDIIKNGGDTSGRQTVVREEVMKTIEPKIYESDEFRIVVRPTSPSKTKDFFKTRMDEFAPDNSKPPIRPIRRKEHIYEDIEEPQDVKILTTRFIQSELNFPGWADDRHNLYKPHDAKEKTQSLKRDKKQGKLFGFLGKKSSKDVEDSDHEKDIIEKQDKEPSKEIIAKYDGYDGEGTDKKVGFFGIFGKKTRKEDMAEKPEIKDDSKMQSGLPIADNKPESSHPQELIETKMDPDQEGQKDKKKIKKEKPQSESEDESESKKNLFGLFGKKGKKDLKKDTKPAKQVLLSEAALKDMKDTATFLTTEVEYFDDVKPVLVERVPEKTKKAEETLKPTQQKDKHFPKKQKQKQEKRESSVSDDEVDATRKTGIFNIFTKKKREKSRERSPKPISETKISEEVVKQIIETNNFLHNEVQAYNDAKPLNGFLKIRTEDKDGADVISISTTKRTIEEYTPSDGIPEKIIKEIEVTEQMKITKRKIITEPTAVKHEITLRDIQKQSPTTEEKVTVTNEKQTLIQIAEPSKDISKQSELIKDAHIPKAKEVNKEVLMDMILTSNFLKDEIEHFDDVKVSSKEVTKSKRESSKEMERAAELPTIPFAKPQRSEEDHHSEFEEVILATNNFLTEEVSHFSDVRPIIREDISNAKKEPSKKDKKIKQRSSSSEDETETKSLLKIFTKKEKKSKQKRGKTENVDVKADPQNVILEGKPIYSEEFLQMIKKTDAFLTDEVMKYHDVKCIIKENPDTCKKEDVETVERVKTIPAKPIDNQDSLQTVLECTNKFLVDEITHFDDVIEANKESATGETTKKIKDKGEHGGKDAIVSEGDGDSGKSAGFFKLFGRKDKKEKAEKPTAEIKIDEPPTAKRGISDANLESSKEKATYTETFKQILTETNNFLENEVKNFYDVKLVATEEKPLKSRQSLPESKSKKKLMKGKRDGSESGDESDTGKSGFFKLFGKKEKKGKDDISPSKISETELVKRTSADNTEIQKVLSETSKFLSDEIVHFEDVRPIHYTTQSASASNLNLREKKQKEKTPQGINEEETDNVKTTGFFKLFGKKNKKETDDKEPAETPETVKYEKQIEQTKEDQKLSKAKVKKQKNEDESSKSFFDIFGKKDKTTKDIKTTELSADVIKNMKDTEQFLKQEVDNFDDVKSPPITESGKALDDKMTNGITKSMEPKVYDRKDTKVVTYSPKEITTKEFIVNVNKTIEKVEKEIPTNDSELHIAPGMPSLTMKPLEEHYESEISVSQPFKKLKEGENFTMHEVTKLSDKIPPPPISEEVMRNMIHTSNFLNQEIARFEDVRPIVQEKFLDKRQKGTEDSSKKSNFFGLFGKKDKKTEEAGAVLRTDIADSENQHFLPPNEKKRSDKASTEFAESVHATNNFLNNEIKNYDDVKQARKDSPALEIPKPDSKTTKEQSELKEDRSKGKSIFGLFSRKSEERGEPEPEKTTMKEKRERRKSGSPFRFFSKKPKDDKTDSKTDQKATMSEEAVRNIYETNNFLSNEISNYEDVKEAKVGKLEKDLKKAVAFVESTISDPREVQQVEKVVVIIRDDIPITKLEETTHQKEACISIPETVPLLLKTTKPGEEETCDEKEEKDDLAKEVQKTTVLLSEFKEQVATKTSQEKIHLMQKEIIPEVKTEQHRKGKLYEEQIMQSRYDEASKSLTLDGTTTTSAQTVSGKESTTNLPSASNIRKDVSVDIDAPHLPDDLQELDKTKNEKKKKEKPKSGGFLSKLGDKITGKTKEHKEDVQVTSKEVQKTVEDLKCGIDKVQDNIQKIQEQISDVKSPIKSVIIQKTDDFLLNEKSAAVPLQRPTLVGTEVDNTELTPKQEKENQHESFLTELGTKIFGTRKGKDDVGLDISPTKQTIIGLPTNEVEKHLSVISKDIAHPEMQTEMTKFDTSRADLLKMDEKDIEDVFKTGEKTVQKGTAQSRTILDIKEVIEKSVSDLDDAPMTSPQTIKKGSVDVLETSADTDTIRDSLTKSVETVIERSTRMLETFGTTGSIKDHVAEDPKNIKEISSEVLEKFVATDTVQYPTTQTAKTIRESTEVLKTLEDTDVVKDIATKTTETIKETSTETLKAFGASDTAIDPVIKCAETIRVRSTEMLKTIADTDTIKDPVTKAAETIRESGSEVLKTFADTDTVKDSCTKTAESIKESGTKVLRPFGASDPAVDSGAKVDETVKVRSTEVLKTIADTDTIKDPVKKAAETIRESSSEVLKTFADTDIIKDSVTKTAKTTKEISIEALKTFGDTATDPFTKGADTDTIKDYTTKAAETTREGSTGILKTDTVKDPVTKAVESLNYEVIAKIADITGDEVNVEAEDKHSTNSSVSKKMLDDTTDIKTQLSESIKKGISKQTESFASDIPSKISTEDQVKVKTADLTSAVIDSIKNIEELAKYANNFIENVDQDIKRVSNDKMNNVVRSAATSVATTENQIQKMLENETKSLSTKLADNIALKGDAAVILEKDADSVSHGDNEQCLKEGTKGGREETVQKDTVIQVSKKASEPKPSETSTSAKKGASEENVSLDDISNQMEQMRKRISEVKSQTINQDITPKSEECSSNKSNDMLSEIRESAIDTCKHGKDKMIKARPLITSPTLPRRAESQRIVRGDIPYCVEVTSTSRDLSSDDESYVVTEPLDSSARISEDQRKRKPLFHIESEEDSFEFSCGRKEPIYDSNVPDSFSEHRSDIVVTDLDDYDDILITDTQPEAKVLYESTQSIQQPTDTDLIEQKLAKIEKILGSLEQQEAFKDGAKEAKLKRVERKFERMASEALEKEQFEGKASKLTTPEVEERRETDFRQMTSQMSTEEVADFQKEYAALWDEQTFSHSDEWDTSKTPDSQAEELPQGNVVYMGPVTLNKDTSVNKAGVEVDVIPIMRSPCPSPKLTRKNKRAKSELGFRSGEKRVDDDSGSLPDLNTYKKGIIIDTIMHAHPDMFLTPVGSTESIKSEGGMAKSLGSGDSLSKGRIMNAVVHWLQKSSPFDSTQSLCSNQTSIVDDTEASTSKSECNQVPDIFVSEDEVLVIPRQMTKISKRTRRKNKKSKKNYRLEVSQLTKKIAENDISITADAMPKPKPRTAKSPDTQSSFERSDSLSRAQPISPVRDDTLDADDSVGTTPDTYSDKKRFWEYMTQEGKIEPSVKKRFSLYEETATEKINIAKKRTSVHEVYVEPPIPKPRVTLQSSLSIAEVTEEQISKADEKHPISEYKSSFIDPSLHSGAKYIPTTEKHDQELKDESDSEQELSNNQSTGHENTGYISDSGDVEHYISDSEIEDRVPQIRDRQMSVFHPSAATKKSIYERSMSLPTEDLYDLSAKNALLRKQYYESQIKKEMVEDQLMTELEEEPSPERKTLSFIAEEPCGSKTIPSETISESSSVKDIAKAFGDTVKTQSKVQTQISHDEISEKSEYSERKSVKDLAKSFEESGSIISTKMKSKPKPDKGGVVDSLPKQSKLDLYEKDDDEIHGKEIKPLERDLKHMEESVDESTTDVTMQDFETSEELGSKEIDEFSRKQYDFSTQDIPESPKLSLTTYQSDLQLKPTPKDEDILDDVSEIDEKSEESKLTYASEIEKDNVVVRETDQLNEMQPPNLLKKDKDEIEEISEISQEKSDASRIICTSDADRDIYKREHQFSDVKDFIKLNGKSPVQPSIESTDIATNMTIKEKQEFMALKSEDQLSLSAERMAKDKDTEVDTHIQQSSTESEQSVFSDHSIDVGVANLKEEQTSKPSDSMEVHVDKSEIEDSEKLAELEDGTDIETKSIESLNAIEMSPKTSFYTDEKIPEITVSLSGKQRRISEESDESEKRDTPEIYQPEEHTQDTVWEVSIESQLVEENVAETAKEIIVEKDDDLSSSVHEESDLGSEIHQDHSESSTSDKVKSESHDEIEKLLLESLHQQKISEEDAKVIASELLADIEAEIQKRDTTKITTVNPDLSQNEISEYLRQLAEAKGLDSREVELVQSVLARKQRQLSKLSRGDTQASSMEITDEDLKYSGGEYSPSGSRGNILEAQIEHLEVERSVERKLSRELGLTLGDHFVLGRGDSPDNDFSDEGKYAEHKTEKDTKVNEKYQINKERTTCFQKDDQTTQASMQETEIKDIEARILISETDRYEEDNFKVTKREITDVEEDTKNISGISITINETTADDLVKCETHLGIGDLDHTQLSGKFISQEEVVENVGREEIKRDTTTTKELEGSTTSKIDMVVDKREETSINKDVEYKISQISTHQKISSSSVIVDSSHTESRTTSTIVDEILSEDIPKLVTDHQVTTVVEVKRTSSDESKSDDVKSPEEQVSTSSSGKKSSEKDRIDVILRKPKLQSDTSSSSTIFKPDRKSGIEFENYSSSGESHYQSFELDSGKSRPCSSDVEGLIAAGSSEYESALTEQDVSSAPTHMTSYHTAVSSLSSKESMKSLDSESSGNLASIEVSEASETLVPSEYDPGDATGQTLDDISVDRGLFIKRHSTEISDSELIYPDQESIDISEEDVEVKGSEEMPSKMKRSCEMTFQPEPKCLVPDSPQFEITQDVDERFGTSLDEGSVLSVSLSSTSSATALRTVIEQAPAEGERHETILSSRGTLDHLIGDEIVRQSQHSIATSTHVQDEDIHIDSVTITTSTIAENGTQNVSTQVTSQEEPKVKDEPFDPKKRGHRRCESTISTNILSSMSAEVEKKLHSDLAESDKFITGLSIKEGRSHEKKDIDEAEKDDYYETEADQGFHRDLREGRYLETEYENDVFDTSRPQSQVSKSDSERERITSTAYSDSELAELAKQMSESVTDPIERPTTPEPCEECEIKDDTPEFSSEAQASVGELEQEYSSAIARAHEIIEIKKQILMEVTSDKSFHKDVFDKRDSQTGKLSSTSSEKSSFEEAEAEAAFSMVAHISPAHKIKQICPILEDEDAEKHELETREKVQKEFERKRQQARDLSPSSIPDIKVTQHMAPIVDSGFHYPDLDLEKAAIASETLKESKIQSDDKEIGESIKNKEDSKKLDFHESDVTLNKLPDEEKQETVSPLQTCKTYETPPSPTDSPSSDSFEMLEKPDLIDDFVVIEEVAKEAQEMDTEGKSIKITSKKVAKKTDKEIEEYLVKSAPSPVTKMTDIKYYPDGSSSEELGFDFEESPPQPGQKPGTTGKSPRDYVYEYDRELEANKKWMEQQFQGNQAAMLAAGYGYEMEFERGPLEDIKEEDINDIDSSRIGSLSSQKEYGSSSIKDSYSSTPEYDVLAGRKYFTRSAEHDDVSMSSLQEFENLERAMSLEHRRCIAGSQDSSSNGSYKNRFHPGRSGQGDDVSVNSLKEFEGLEMACAAAHKIEVKAKEEEAILAQIDEGPESVASETESCETMSGTDKKLIPESDDEEYEKRLFEIDEIIRQAQTNVERFIEVEKTESLGRGDSFEEVAKVPDLDLDTPVARGSTKVQWSPGDPMMASTDSLDLKADKPAHHDSSDSLDQKTPAIDVMTASTDSIEFQAQKSGRDNIMSDSIEIRDGDKSYMITSDSLEMMASTKPCLMTSDSIDEDGSRIGGFDQSSSSTGKDFSSSVKDDMGELIEVKPPQVGETADSVASTSTATHATYQYESDSVYSGSFTSGGSNTMVSSTDTIDPTIHQTDIAAAVRKVWFDDDAAGSSKAYKTEYIQDSKPYVTEVIEPCEEDGYSHTIHRRVDLPPDIKKITFTGPDADEQLRQFIENFGEGEEVHETQDVDKDGNIHIKRVIQKRYIIQSDQKDPECVMKRLYTDDKGTTTIYTQQVDLHQAQSSVHSLLPSSGRDKTGEPLELKEDKTPVQQPATTVTTTTVTRAQGARRRPLRYEISIDDQTEVDPREHDWRFSLPQHVETEEAAQREAQQQSQQDRPIQDQHMLSDEMKRLLQELEEESKK